MSEAARRSPAFSKSIRWMSCFSGGANFPSSCFDVTEQTHLGQAALVVWGSRENPLLSLVYTLVQFLIKLLIVAGN